MWPFKHKCHYKAVAARPGYELPIANPFSAPFTGSRKSGTLVLARCKCGHVLTHFVEGVWTASELNLPCGDDEAIDKLIEGSKR